MYLVDPKQVEFSCFEPFPHVQEVITDMRLAARTFVGLVLEMERRYTFLKEKGYRDMLSYNKENPEDKQPYILCVVDEFADLKAQFPEVEEYIQRLGQKARGAGIHLVLATQYPLADVISSVIKSNLPSVFCFSLKTQREYTTVFGEGIPYRLLGLGDGVAKIEGAEHRFERFQSPLIEMNQKEETRIMEKLATMFEITHDIEVSLPMEEEIDLLLKLKRIIKTTKETRITKLQKVMGIRTNDLQDLMAELVEQKFLYKHKSRSKGYELIATEEELEELEDWDETE